MNALPPEGIVPDRDAIERHLSILFEGAEGLVPIRLFSEKGTPDRRPQTPFLKLGPGLVSAVHRHAVAAAREGVGLFVVPGTVEQPGSATAKDVSSTAVILVDLDEGDIAAKSAHLAKHLGQPTLDVASGGLTADGKQKRHLYWRLTEVARGSDLEEVCRLRRVIADKVGADPAFASAHQPIRIAGSVHGKHGVRTKVTLQASSESRYELAELVERVDAMPTLASPQQARSHQNRLETTDLRATDLMSVVVREGGVDGITRFDAISKVIGHWVRETRTGRVSLEQAWLAVTEHNAACIHPSWPEDRLRHEFEALRRRDRLMSVPAAGAEKQGNAKSSAGAAPDISEDGLADRLSRLHSQDWRYVSPWGAWLKWAGTNWKIDAIGEVFQVARLVCRDEVLADTKSREARRIRSDRTIRAVERIVRSDPRHAARPEDWDADPMLLNTPAGIVDLRTGELRPHDRGAAITRITRASPGDNCPQWQAFIDEITNGACQLADYLMRVAGYCLTGETGEQCFFFLHGAGANGKSVFLSVLSHVLGDYAATAPLETFMAGHGDRHPTDLAGLRGARLVTVNETETGRAWAESRIKAITGGDMLRVRLMHRDFFEFRPTFKLLVAGNHRPKLLGVGEAMRRRLHLIPFEVTIPPERRDKQLVSKFEAERDGILGWMLAGCADWQRSGLAAPAEVLNAAQAYLEDEDLVGQWIGEACRVDPSTSALSSQLFTGWSDWAERNGVERGSQRDLAEALKARGFQQIRSSRARGWRGIAPLGSGPATQGER